MNGKVTFIGAGPGAADLITLRGAALLSEADTVIYAGSLVDERLLETAKNAELHNSAKLALPEVLKIICRDYEAGKKVVRLHTGDPAMYGAVSEQYRELDALGIPYDVVPGVSSVFAAAAALKVELTMPEVSQSVIFTRNAGRTPVPENEALEKLAAPGTTMAIFLSVEGMQELCDKLIAAGRSPQTSIAVVYRASWDNQQIVRGTLSDIAGKVEAAGIKRQAMIIVGDVLNREGALSKLYDKEFATGFRHHRFRGKVALFALTHQAAFKASEIAAGLENDAVVFAPSKFESSIPECRRKCFGEGEFGKMLSDNWNQFDAFVMVMACGIAVRHVGALCKDKKSDPAVVVCDERGDYAISLLSGHVGGANDLARDIARITNGQPVITTSSDVQNLPAFDEYARKNHYRILSSENLTAIASAIVNGDTIKVKMSAARFECDFAGYSNFVYCGDPGDDFIVVRAGDREIQLEKRYFAVGIGCRKGVSRERIAAVVEQVLSANGFHWNDIEFLASADVKADEPGLLEFASIVDKKIQFFSAEELSSVKVPNPSKQPLKHIGTESVAEAAALLAAGKNSKIVVEKYADCDVTVAIAEMVRI